jgi:hypothetical protein
MFVLLSQEVFGGLCPGERVGAAVPAVPNVVDQHIDPGKALEDLVGQPPHLRLGGQVGHEHLPRPAAGGGADLVRRALGGARGPGR